MNRQLLAAASASAVLFTLIACDRSPPRDRPEPAASEVRSGAPSMHVSVRRPTCTNAEVKRLVDGFNRAVELAAYGDVVGVLRTDVELTKSLSPSCMQAIVASQGGTTPPCSLEEKELILDVMEESFTAAQRLDFDGSMRPLQRLRAVSARCQEAFAAAQQRAAPPRASAFGGPSTVEDHGGGRYVVPGVGYCDPTSCGAY